MSSTAVANTNQGDGRKSVLMAMADRYGMEPAAFEATVRATCMPTGRNQPPATKEQFAAFLLVAKQYDLNPILKEIYAFPARNGGIVPVVSIDGWVNLINSHGKADGFEFDMEEDAQGKPTKCTCTMYRKDRSHPVVVTEYFTECFRPTDPWKSHPHRMLRHKTLIQAARYAFGFAGIYDEDEAERIANMKLVGSSSTAPARPDRGNYEDEGGQQETEQEPDEGQPFEFTDVFGQVHAEPPLSAGDFSDKMVDALNGALKADDPNAAVETVLTYNAEGLDRLPEDMQDVLHAHIEHINQRLREIAVTNKREQEKAEAAAHKAKAAEAAEQQDTGRDEDRSDVDTHPEARQEETQREEHPLSDYVVPLERGPSGSPLERKFAQAISKMLREAGSAIEIDRILQANAEALTPSDDGTGLSKYFATQVTTAADQARMQFRE